MHLDRWTLLLQTVNFAVLIWLLHRFLYRPVMRLSDARRAQVQRELAQGHALAAQAQAQMADIQRQREGIAAERDAALQAAAAQAQEAAAKRQRQAEQEAQTLLAQAHSTLLGERQAAMRESHQAALDLGAVMALRLLDELPRALREEAWLERIAQYLSTLPREQLQALHAQLGHGARLELATAQALDQAARQRWGERLQHLLGDEAVIDFVTDVGLMAGAQLRFPQSKLDFSWQGALASLREQLQDTALPEHLPATPSHVQPA